MGFFFTLHPYIHFSFFNDCFISIFQTIVLIRKFWQSSKQEVKRLRRPVFLLCKVNYCTSISPGNAPERFCCAWQRVFVSPNSHNYSHRLCRHLESLHGLIKEIKDKIRQLWQCSDWAGCIEGCLCLIEVGSYWVLYQNTVEKKLQKKKVKRALFSKKNCPYGAE